MFKMHMKACRNTVGKPQCISSTRDDDSDWFKGTTCLFKYRKLEKN